MKNNKKKPIVYIDMDGTLVDFVSAFDRVEPEILREYGGVLNSRRLNLD